MSELALPDPEPEPFSATSLEFAPEDIEDSSRMEKIVSSIAQAAISLIDRQDGIRKEIFVYRREKILPLPGYSKESKVRLVHYNDVKSVNSHAAKVIHEANPERWKIGIDVTVPEASEQPTQSKPERLKLVTDRYRIIADDEEHPILKQYIYDETRDVEVIRDVTDDRVAKLCDVLESLGTDVRPAL